MSIEYPVYIDVKYVNGAPSGEQLRLDFITNGEENDGGVEQYDDGGPLNRPSKQIQENVMILRNDTMHQQQSIIELVDAVNRIQGDGYAEIGQRLDTVELLASSNKTRIDNLNTQIGVASTDTTPATGLTLDVETNTTVLGNRHVDDKRNTADSAGAIWDEIWFIKKNLIGNVYNYDPNGNFVQSVDYNSGIAGQLQNMSTDFDTIQSDMSDIETTIGEPTDNADTLYGEINANASSISSLSSRVDTLEAVEPGVSSYAYLTSEGLATQSFGPTPINIDEFTNLQGPAQDYVNTGTELTYSGLDSRIGVTVRAGITHDNASAVTITFNFIKTSEGVPQTIPVSRTIPPGVMRDITAAVPFHIKSGDTIAVELETSATAELDIYDFSLKME